LYLDKENRRQTIANRLDQLDVPLSLVSYRGGWSAPPPGMADELELLELAGGYKPLIIFDSLVRFQVTEVKGISEMSGVMALFRRLVNAGATVIVLHHCSKGYLSKGIDKLRGAGDIGAAADLVFILERDREGGTIDFRCEKDRDGVE